MVYLRFLNQTKPNQTKLKLKLELELDTYLPAHLTKVISSNKKNKQKSAASKQLAITPPPLPPTAGAAGAAAGDTFFFGCLVSFAVYVMNTVQCISCHVMSNYVIYPMLMLLLILE